MKKCFTACSCPRWAGDYTFMFRTYHISLMIFCNEIEINIRHSNQHYTRQKEAYHNQYHYRAHYHDHDVAHWKSGWWLMMVMMMMMMKSHLHSVTVPTEQVRTRCDVASLAACSHVFTIAWHTTRSHWLPFPSTARASLHSAWRSR